MSQPEREYHKCLSPDHNRGPDDEPIRLSLLEARQMVNRGLACADADELQELINEFSSLLADDADRRYEIWPTC